MAYHKLTNDTGGTADDRRVEADRILAILVENDLDISSCTEREQQFLTQLIDGERMAISPKQLFWLRDIKDKYL